MKGLACVCVCFLVAAGHSVPGTELFGLLQFKGRSQMKTQETATSTDTANLGADDNEYSDNLEADDGSVVQHMQTGDNQSHSSDKCPTMPSNFCSKTAPHPVCREFLAGCLDKCPKVTDNYANFRANCGYAFCCGANDNHYSSEGRCEELMQRKVDKKVKDHKHKGQSEMRIILVQRVCNSMCKIHNRNKKGKKGSLLQDMSANLIRRASEQDGLINKASTDETMDEKCPECEEK